MKQKEKQKAGLLEHCYAQLNSLDPLLLDSINRLIGSIRISRSIQFRLGKRMNIAAVLIMVMEMRIVM